MATDVSTSAGDALTRLLEIALELGSVHDLDGILQVATTGVCGAVGCQRASLFIHDDESGELYTRVATTLEISEIRHSVQKGIVGWVARERKLLSVPVPAADSRWDSSVDLRTGFRTLNILAAPVLSASGELLGVLQLLNKPAGFAALDEQLVQAFAAHVAVALERRRLESEAREAWELRQALEMGHRIQATFLPSALPQIPGYDVAAWWQPAEFVSGDYYDWLPLKAGRWGFAVGDVSGHGLAASLIMATVRAMAHVLSRTSPDVHEFIETLRECIEPDLQNSRFITCCFVILNPETHQVEWANAGHAPAVHYCARTEACHRLKPTTIPLGFPSIPFPDDGSQLQLGAGDLLVLGTDGIVEVRNLAGEMYGSRRLDQRIREHAHRTPEDIVSAISQDVLNFQDGEFPPDDMTLVVIRRRQ